VVPHAAAPAGVLEKVGQVWPDRKTGASVGNFLPPARPSRQAANRIDGILSPAPTNRGSSGQRQRRKQQRSQQPVAQRLGRPVARNRESPRATRCCLCAPSPRAGGSASEGELGASKLLDTRAAGSNLSDFEWPQCGRLPSCGQAATRHHARTLLERNRQHTLQCPSAPLCCGLEPDRLRDGSPEPRFSTPSPSTTLGASLAVAT